MQLNKIARVFEDIGGYYFCDDVRPLDARGFAYPTKAEAQRAAVRDGYTHGIGSGMYRDGVSKLITD